jgi:hypothetical protein
MFPVRYELNFHILTGRNSIFEPRVEAGSNTSTVALRVVGGDEKGTQCRGYNWDTLLRRIQIRGLGPPGSGSLESETVKCGHESRRTLT